MRRRRKRWRLSRQLDSVGATSKQLDHINIFPSSHTRQSFSGACQKKEEKEDVIRSESVGLGPDASALVWLELVRRQAEEQIHANPTTKTTSTFLASPNPRKAQLKPCQILAPETSPSLELPSGARVARLNLDQTLGRANQPKQTTISRRRRTVVMNLLLLVLFLLFLLYLVVGSVGCSRISHHNESYLISSYNTTSGQHEPVGRQRKLGLHYYNQSRRRTRSAGHRHNQSEQTVSRPIRATTSSNLHLRQSFGPAQVEELEGGQVHEVLAQTKQGLFRGRLMLARGEQSETTTSSSSQSDSGGGGYKNVAGFLGIRYASAPIRRLRFMPPTPFQYAPNQVHNMQHFGPICKQRYPIPELSRPQTEATERADSSSSSGEPLELELSLMRRLMASESYARSSALIKQLRQMEQSEDCLNLNVYAPLEALRGTTTTTTTASGDRSATTDGAAKSGNSSQLLPVLLLIHGQSFDYGSGSVLDPARFVRQTGIIVVTLNYRLNILGFPPKLANDNISRGNLGLMDQVAALHWIRENIRSFGGSLERVSLLGKNEGAIFVNLLMLSPLAKGLFERAVLEDGTALTPLIANHMASSQEQSASKHMSLLAALLNCPFPGSNKSQAHSANSTAGTRAGQQEETIGRTGAVLMLECLRHKPIEQIMQHIPLDLIQLESSSSSGSVPNNKTSQLPPTISARWMEKIQSFRQQQAHNQLVANVATSISSDLQLNSGELQKLLANLALEFATNKSNNNNNSELLSAIWRPSSVQPLFGPLLDGTIVPDEEPAASMLRAHSTFSKRDLLIGITQPALAQMANTLGTASNPSSRRRVSSSVAPPKWRQRIQQPNNKRPRFDYLIMGKHINSQQELEGLSSELAVGLLDKFVRASYRYHQQEISNSIINHYLANPGGGYRVAAAAAATAASLTESKNSSSDADFSSASANGSMEQLGMGQDLEFRKKFGQQQQLLVLHSMLELFDYSLISVPLLKTALIHAVKQLEPVAEIFVAQQFDRWRHQYQQQQQQDETGNNKHSSSTVLDRQVLLNSFLSFASSTLNQTNPQIQPKSTYFYQIDPQLPLGQVEEALEQLEAAASSSSSSNSSIFSTFGWKSVRNSLAGLLIKLHNSPHYLQHSLSFSCPFSGRTNQYNEEQEGEEEGTFHLMRQFGDWICFSRFTPALANFVVTGNVNPTSVAEPESLPEPGDRNDHHAELESLFKRVGDFERECKGFLAGFRQQSDASLHQVQDNENNKQQVVEILETTSDGGAIYEQTNEMRQQVRECSMRLNTLTVAYLRVSSLLFPIHKQQSENQQLSDWKRQHPIDDYSESETHDNWPAFNLFSQKVASLADIQMKQPTGSSIKKPPIERMWRVSEIFSTSTTLEQPQLDGATSTNKLLAESLFWSNFIPALNCSRTQPIIPSTNSQLLMIAASSGSTNPFVRSVLNSSSLLGINLQFNCHQNQPKTALDFIESLSSSISRQLKLSIQQHLTSAELAHRQQLSSTTTTANNASSSSSVNHHKLRMANISAGGSLNQFEQLDEQTDERLTTVSGGNISGLVPPSGGFDLNFLKRVTGVEIYGFKYAALVLFLGGLLLSFSLVSGACAVIKQRTEQRKLLEQQQQQQQQVNSNLEHTEGATCTVSGPEHHSSVSHAQESHIDEVPIEATNVANNNNNNNYPNSFGFVLGNRSSSAGLGPEEAYHVCSQSQLQFVSAAANQAPAPPLVYCYPTEEGATVAANNSIESPQLPSSLEASLGHEVSGSMKMSRSCHSHPTAHFNQNHQHQQSQDSQMNQEPIMVPILSNSLVHHHQNNNNNNNTSLGTNQQSSLESTDHDNRSVAFSGVLSGGSMSTLAGNGTAPVVSKKRVKISDPTTGQHCSSTLGRGLRDHAPSLSGNNNSSGSFYCPVHRNLSNNSLNNTNQLISSSSFVNNNSQAQLCELNNSNINSNFLTLGSRKRVGKVAKNGASDGYTTAIQESIQTFDGQQLILEQQQRSRDYFVPQQFYRPHQHHHNHNHHHHNHHHQRTLVLEDPSADELALSQDFNGASFELTAASCEGQLGSDVNNNGRYWQNEKQQLYKQ